ncbi:MULTISPECIES: chaperone modulator CbpM [Burkholderia]|uniref:MerR family transcriptional regulator n=1 Tax=Burkholderia anthina TaxID=179879 RepID=A0A7T6VIJ0_9BURK|nr:MULTISPECIES: chaperone modulator CbpM [Burkholderia]MBY4868541.1 chaperone modulator CbpM [Burkholderia anthina]QQK04584.1 MerR family transcriptional regulator [Burkholderia anthina]
MKESRAVYLQGQVIDERVELTFVELCRISGASEEELTLWVAEGALDPLGACPREWRFSGAVLRRVAIAQRLSRDLMINPPGIALALDLLDEIDALRAVTRATPAAHLESGPPAGPA